MIRIILALAATLAATSAQADLWRNGSHGIYPSGIFCETPEAAAKAFQVLDAQSNDPLFDSQTFLEQIAPLSCLFVREIPVEFIGVVESIPPVESSLSDVRTIVIVHWKAFGTVDAYSWLRADYIGVEIPPTAPPTAPPLPAPERQIMPYGTGWPAFLYQIGG